MKQALHIFKKDFRYLSKEICLLVGLAGVFAWAETHVANPVWAELLMVAAAAYLIARLVHAETIPGDRQFWITRPYDWRSLLAAKFLGLLVFVNLPILIARLCILLRFEFPLHTILAPLVWSQFVMFTGATLAVAALATVTPGLVPFIFVGLIALATGFGIDSSIAPPSIRASRLMLDASQWVWNSIVVLTLIAIAVPVLYMQYRKRRTFLSRCVISLITILGALAYVYVPWPVAAAIQNKIMRQRFDSKAVRVTFAPDAKRFFMMGRINGVQVGVPVAVQGLPDDVEVIPDAVALTFHTAGGNEWTTGPYNFPALTKQPSGPGAAILNANVVMPRAFFDNAKAQHVKVMGSLYLSLYGDAHARTIPLQAKRVELQDGLWCNVTIFDQLSCESAFRWPNRLVYAKFRDDDVRPFKQTISYSPFPSGLEFTVLEWRQVFAPHGQRQVTIITKRPIASFRQDFKIDNFDLASYSQ